MTNDVEKQIVGWREWISLPELGVSALKVKVDTGARTSALHAFNVETFEIDKRKKVRFGIHPLQRRRDIEIFCTADIVDERVVTDSGGHREKRLVIKTPVQLGNFKWEVEFTLTDRDTMRFRALLGRTAMESRLIVNPEESFLSGKSLINEYLNVLKRETL